MAGIYIHIPFCKTRCIYCGFFSTTSLHQRRAYVDRVCAELSQRRQYLGGAAVDTIYFGGGTPTQLPVDDIGHILQEIKSIYNVREASEITVESNPDDLTPLVLHRLRDIGVNRLSMGVQTFSDKRLAFLHRRHTSLQAVQAVHDAQEAGFGNISIDLMFGFPGQTLSQWQTDVDTALSLGVQHISAYSLMYEDGTLLGKMLDRGEVTEVDDDLSLAMYDYLIDALAAAGYEHYELSNFALPGYRSRHNSSYWQGTPYLGVGAGAHSFDGRCRHFNPDSLEQYLGSSPLEEEQLDDDARYNEHVFTALRTCDGLSLCALINLFGVQRGEYVLRNAQPHIEGGLLSFDGDRLRLTRSGLFVSNDVMSDLMLV